MARSTLMASLRRAYKVARASINTGIPADDLAEICQQKTTRRQLLYGGLGLASAIATATWDRGRDSQAVANSPKVLVVGAGIAGLIAAYRMRQVGIQSDIIEARNQVGGRILSLARAAGTSVTVEQGGEFLDSGHTSMLSLAGELGLQVVDLQPADAGLLPETFYFEGRKIPETEIIEWFKPLAQKIEQDLATLGDGDITYRTKNRAAINLDNTSIAQYLNQAQINPTLNQILRIAYTIEYGREPEEQSCLNLLLLIGTDTNKFTVFGESDERYHIKGGNGQIPDILAQALTNSIETGIQLEAIRQTPNGRYQVNFRSGYSRFERIYERVLLALPFSTLRLVSLNLNLPRVKQKAIAELGYGTNAKLITAYREKIWRSRYQSTAAVFADTGFQNTWEPTRYQTGSSGLVTNFTGGKQGLSLGKGTAESQAQILLPQLNQIFPGINNLRQGKAIRANWPEGEFSRGSYACYLVGQWTSIAGSEQGRVGNLFFAGEHCSLSFQGYMEGACRTGEIAALRILRSMGVSPKAPKQNVNNSLLQRRNGLIRRQDFSNDLPELE
jgi:monoamine oxidase